MKRDIAQFVYSCLTGQKSKVEHQRPGGLMQLLDVPEWKWDNISMDFVTGLPNTAKGNDVIWVVMNRLAKSAHFIPVKISFSLQKLAEIYISIIVKLHGIPSSIFSDRDPRFSIGMTPFEALYGRRCRTPICWYETGENVVIGPEIVHQTTEKVKMIQEKMKASQSRKKSYHGKRRKALEFSEGDHVFLRVTLLRKYIHYPSHVIQMDDMHVRDNLTVEALPLRIADREVKKLRGKEIALVKAVWGGPAEGSMT
ncbi:uncharacterized protein LOC127137200 [Lathyrus oleraceus]|uniref:uncharacterized protein LOC127137200 n=1 Tax=Pisum sativum TaxID=3888 RepID=UPI0021CF954D|nr:uncharacterized protein LOC127137200 [Pisum sativum]